MTAELQSRLSPVLSNEARLSYVGVRDKRTSGAAFPSITIKNVGNGTVNIGNEYSSMANGLDQDVWTLEDNLTWYKGNHTLTFGTHNELYSFDNLFIQNLYGSYNFLSADDFFTYYNGVLDGTGMYTDSKGHLNPIGTLINTYNDVTGEGKKPFTMGGGTYARHFPYAVSFGPEHTDIEIPSFAGPMHGANEGTPFEKLVEALKIYILALLRLQEIEL